MAAKRKGKAGGDPDGSGGPKTRGKAGRRRLPKTEKRKNAVQFKTRDDEQDLLDRCAKMDRLDVGVWARNMVLLCAEHRAAGLEPIVAFSSALDALSSKNPDLYRRIIGELEQLRNRIVHGVAAGT